MMIRVLSFVICIGGLNSCLGGGQEDAWFAGDTHEPTCAVAAAACEATLSAERQTEGAEPSDPLLRDARPAVILFIGDGMGPEHVRAASLYAHGVEGALWLESMPFRGEVRTASLSGLTDSAAAATEMATGQVTYNGRIGLDEHGAKLETLVEWAQARGMKTGVVSTAALTHATPASFVSHVMSRHDTEAIARQQLQRSADVMLGGGRAHYRGVAAEGQWQAALQARGFQVVENVAALAAVPADAGSKVFGVFADKHMTYVHDRMVGSSEPTLAQMTEHALRLLERHERGFLLVVEGARIDMASHVMDFKRAVDEVVAFDQAVRVAGEWVEQQGRGTLLVTADHECGGLRVDTAFAAGTYPAVSWRWGQHTNVPVPVFAMGVGTERVHQASWQHRDVWHALQQWLGAAPTVLPRRLVADGDFSDLRFQVAEQRHASSFGVGYNQLDALWVDSDERGVGIGLQGVFEWQENTVLVLLDRRLGDGHGVRSLQRELNDSRGALDRLLSRSRVDFAEGFAPDLALGIQGGAQVRIEDMAQAVGLRSWRSPGSARDFAWLPVVVNYAAAMRVRGEPGASRVGEGMEIFLRWEDILPPGEAPQAGALGIAVVLLNSKGSMVSNQVLPTQEGHVANMSMLNISKWVQVPYGQDLNVDTPLSDPPAVVSLALPTL